jgi:hypothetical protein
MKNQLHISQKSIRKLTSYFLILLISSFINTTSFGQVVVSTTGSFINNNGSGTVTFNLENTNSFDIIITDIDGVTGSSGSLTAELYYNLTPVSAGPAAIDTSAGWHLAASGTFTGVANSSTTVTQNFLSGLSFLVPANTTYGMAVFATGQRYFSHPGGITTDSAGGVKIITGTNIGWGGGTPPAAPGNSPRGWIGEISFVPAIACTGTPSAGDAIASFGLVCSGSSFDLSLANDSLRTGLTYQWQASSSGLPFSYTNMLNDTTRTVTTNQTATSWYRCIVTCAGAASDTSTAVMVTTPTAALAGAYTVDPSSALSSTNFHSVVDVATSLACVGISGPVTIDVAPNSGPYNGAVNFGVIAGVSSTNTVTINGHGNTIETTASPMVGFAGTEYVTFRGFNITGGSGFGIHLGSQSRYITIDSNTIDVGMTSTSTGTVGIVVSGSLTSASTTGNNAQHITISNNEVIGGYYSVSMYGTSPYSNNTGHIIQNNTMRDFYYYGLRLYYADSIQIIGNDIHRLNRPTVSTFYGLYLSSCRNTKVIGNKIHDGGTGSYTAYPIYLSTSANLSGFETEFINNEIYNIDNSSTLYAMYITGTRDGINIFHNTIALDVNGGSSAVRGIFLNTGTSNDNVKNNLITISGNATGTKHCIYSATTSGVASDHNDFFISAAFGSNNIGYWSGNKLTLADWQAASSLDSNSVSIDPVYLNMTAGNLEPFVGALDNLGTPVGVLTDVNGNPRSATTPDIGSVEFTIPFCTSPPVAGMTLTDNATTCKGQDFTLSFDTATSTGIGQTYQWEIANDSVGPYTSMLNDTNIYAVTNQLKTHWYRIALTCSGLTSYTTPVMVYTDSVGVPSSLTIDTSIAASATNFHSFTDLLTVLNCKGVTSPVTITVAPNNTTFIESVPFGAIGGTSATNTITIHGNGNTVESADPIVMSFSGSNYITIDSLNIVSTGANGYTVHVSNASSHISILNSRIEASMTSTSTLSAAFAMSGSATSSTAAGVNGHHITLENNDIVGGYYCMTFMGDASGTFNYGHVIKNNTIRDFYAYGIYMTYADTSRIENNNIHRMNRPSVSTLYAIYPSNSKFLKIIGNRIHHTGTGAYSAYPMYISDLASDSLYESEIINNSIYNINHSSGTFYGIYALTSLDNSKIYHNTIQYDCPVASTSTIRGFFANLSPNNVDFRNNIISLTGGGTGTKTGIYVSTTSTSFISNNNDVFVSSGGTDNYGYWAGGQITLADWQTATGLASNSNDSDPAFTDLANDNLIPLSGNIDNMGAPVGVLTDITGAIRSTTTPDVGAYEFTGVAGDVALLSGELIRSGDCYSFNDTISVTIQNLIGSTIDFSINPINIDWNVTGPQNSFGILSRSFGTLAPGATITLTDWNVNRSMAGTYTLHANLQTSSLNLVAINDTLQPSDYVVKPILSVSPKTASASSPTDTVELKASSPLFPSAGFFITEVCHYKYTVGQPTAGWPSYLIADDYIEITGAPGSDLAGITLEQYDASSMVASYTFPSGTLLSPNGTAVIAIGQLNGSVDSPSDFYYNGTGTYTGTWSSGGAAGVLLRDASSAIIDAVGYGTYTFPTSSGVTATDWSGNTPTGTTTSGNRLTGADVNSATNWVNSSTSPQDPNVLNSGVTLPTPATVTGFNWTYMFSPFSTSPKVTVGPYTTPGLYTYIASYSNACGLFYDTAYVTALSTVPVKLVYFDAKAENQDALLTWQTASELNNSHFDVERSIDGKNFKTIGTVKGNGTTSKTIQYQFMDKEAANVSSTVFYRLRQVDFNGDAELSQTATVRFATTELETVSVAPNPFSSELNLSVNGTKESVLSVTITDLQGRQLSTETYPTVKGTNTISLNHVANLDKGFYFVQIKTEGEIKVIKILRN